MTRTCSLIKAKTTSRSEQGASILVVAILVIVATVMVPAESVEAHQTDRSEYIVEVRADSGEVEKLLRISAADLAHYLGYIGHGVPATGEVLDEARADIAQYLDERVGAIADDEPCELRESRFLGLPGPDGRIHYHQLWQCEPGAEEVVLAHHVMLDKHGGYRHHGTVQVGEDIRQTVFDQSFPTYAVYPPQVDDSPDREDGTDDEAGLAEAEDNEAGATRPSEDVDTASVGEEKTPLPRTSFWRGGWRFWLIVTALLFAVAIIIAVKRFGSVQAEMSE